MDIIALYTFFHPLIDVLGTLCLIALMAGSVLYVAAWIICRIWKGIVAVGVLSFCALLLLIFFG
jgi:hypothetical protein